MAESLGIQHEFDEYGDMDEDLKKALEASKVDK